LAVQVVVIATAFFLKDQVKIVHSCSYLE
jgi:hypothetical protein